MKDIPQVQRKNKYCSPIILPEHIDFIRWAYTDQRWSIKKIAEALGLGAIYLSKIMDTHHIYKRSDREQALRFTCNEHFFDCIDNEASAYWLGFLYADGYILPNKRGFGVTLMADDREHLEKLKQTINFTGSIKQYPPSESGYSDKDYVRMIVSSVTIADVLIRQGCLPNKSSILQYPTCDQVPLELQKHFVRGYMDGDGSILLRRQFNRVPEIALSVTGTKEMIIGIMKFFGCERLALDSRHNGRANSYSIKLGGNLQAQRCLSVLYDQASVYLDRKYEKYLLCIREYQEYMSRAAQ